MPSKTVCSAHLLVVTHPGRWIYLQMKLPNEVTNSIVEMMSKALHTIEKTGPGAFFFPQKGWSWIFQQNFYTPTLDRIAHLIKWWNVQYFKKKHWAATVTVKYKVKCLKAVLLPVSQGSRVNGCHSDDLVAILLILKHLTACTNHSPCTDRLGLSELLFKVPIKCK